MSIHTTFPWPDSAALPAIANSSRTCPNTPPLCPDYKCGGPDASCQLGLTKHADSSPTRGGSSFLVKAPGIGSFSAPSLQQYPPPMGHRAARGSLRMFFHLFLEKNHALKVGDIYTLPCPRDPPDASFRSSITPSTPLQTLPFVFHARRYVHPAFCLIQPGLQKLRSHLPFPKWRPAFPASRASDWVFPPGLPPSSPGGNRTRVPLLESRSKSQLFIVLIPKSRS